MTAVLLDGLGLSTLPALDDSLAELSAWRNRLTSVTCTTTSWARCPTCCATWCGCGI